MGPRLFTAEERVQRTRRARDANAARRSFHAAGLPEIAAWIAGFGGKVIARAPEELVDRVRALHREGLAGF